MTTKELQDFIAKVHQGNNIVKGGAWAATTGEDGGKDWVYIGDKK